MAYIIPVETSEFEIDYLWIKDQCYIVAGDDPVTGLIAPPGGHRKNGTRRVRGLIKKISEKFGTAAGRERTEECGESLQVRLAHSTTTSFFMDRDSKNFVPDKEAHPRRKLKLHSYLLKLVTGGTPLECEPAKFRNPRFIELDYLVQNTGKLRPSFARALRNFRKLDLLPMRYTPNLVEINLEMTRHRMLNEMDLPPDFVMSYLGPSVAIPARQEQRQMAV